MLLVGTVPSFKLTFQASTMPQRLCNRGLYYRLRAHRGEEVYYMHLGIAFPVILLLELWHFVLQRAGLGPNGYGGSQFMEVAGAFYFLNMASIL